MFVRYINILECLSDASFIISYIESVEESVIIVVVMNLCVSICMAQPVCVLIKKNRYHSADELPGVGSPAKPVRSASSFAARVAATRAANSPPP